MNNYSRIISAIYKLKENSKLNEIIYAPHVYRFLKKSKNMYEWVFLKKKGGNEINYSDNKKFFSDNIDRIKKNIEKLDDEQSRQVYKEMIMFRCVKSNKLPSSYSVNDLYFAKGVVTLSEHEVFIDCGGFLGDTIKSFRKVVNEKFDHIVTYEPDYENCVKLYNYIGKTKNITVKRCGCWSRTCQLPFLSGYSDGSYLVDTLDKNWAPSNMIVEVEVETIDECNECQGATFIKMDIEGAELEALKGCHKVIMKNHPVLAISIYHSNHDMLDILEYLTNKYGFYRYYIRQHSPSIINETVLYAIPKES